MRIILNEDINAVNIVKQGLKNNQGYCPCELEQTEDTKCMCKAFREQTKPGPCHCGLYIKVED